METIVKKAACYCRVSHEEQKLHGLSIEAQKEDLKQYCKRNNYKIYKFYIDEGLTAKNTKRQGLQNLLSDLDKDKFDIVLFTKLDRLSRNIIDANLLDEKFKNNNVCMKAIFEDDIDTSTADGKFTFNLKLSLAERELDKTSERIKDIFRYKIERNEVISGSVPKGYKIVDKKLAIDENTAWIVKKSFDLVEELMSARAAFIQINTVYNQPTSLRSFSKLLKNVIYTGTYKSKNYYKENYCEPIISLEQFNNVQRILKNNKQYTSNNRKETYIFSGLLRCSHCGYKIVGHYSNRSGKNVIKTYRCNRYSIYKDCDQKKSINEKKLEKVLLSCIVEEYKNYLYSFDVSSKKTNSIDVSQNKSKIQKKIDKLRELYLNDLISLEDYKKDYAIFTQALKEIESKEVTKVAPKDADKILSILDNIETIYYNLDATERKRFWSSFIDVITIDGNYNIDIKFL